MQNMQSIENFLQEQQANYGFCFSIVSISNTITQQILAILSSSEIAMWERFILPKRQNEWLAGRMAAKKAVLALWGKNLESIEEYKKLELGYGEKGVPYVLGFPEIHVSISHSYGIAVALAGYFSIGIDLEKEFLPEKALLRFFFSPQEEKYLLSLAEEEQKKIATLLWTRKEAIVKLLKQGASLCFQEISTLENQVDIFSHCVQVVSFSTNEYAISLALEKKMTYQEIYEKTQTIVQEYLRLEKEEIQPQSHLMMDFNADSIAIVEIGFRIAETFQIPIPPAQDSLLIFENTIAYIQQELLKKQS